LTNFTGGYLDATYTIIPTANSCSGNSFTFIVRVYPKPIIGLKTNTFCSGGSFSITPYDGPPIGDVVPTGTTYSWSAPVVSGLSGTSSGTAQSSFNSGTLYNSTNYPIIVDFAVTPRANPQDGDAFIVRITVNPLPKASIDITETSGLVVNDKTICSNETATITAVPVVGTLIDYEYTWSVPSGINTPTLTTTSFNSNVAGQYSLSLRNITTGCSSGSITSTTLTVTTAPTVGTISSSYNTVCVNSSIQLQGIGSTGGATPYTSYWWYTSTSSGPATTSSSTVNVTGVSAGNGSINYSVLDQVGCMSSRSTPFNITVYALPLAPIVTPVNVVYDGLAHQVVGSPAAAPFGNDIIEWYANSSGGSAIIPAPSITNVGSLTSYAQAINNTTGCVNLNRVSTSVTISRKALTITANNVQKIYDRIAFAGPNTVEYSGFVNGELQSALSGSLTFGGTAINAVNAGVYDIVPSGYTSTNYAITYVSGLLTINKKGLTISNAAVLNKVYDATDIATMNAGSLVGLIAADIPNVTLNYSAKFPNKNVGTNLSITSISTISGSAASNYTLDPTINVTASITPKQIDAIGVLTSNKIYDGTNNATVTGGGFNAAIDPGTGTSSDRTPYKNDIIQLLPSGNFANKNVGNNIAITSTSTITGADANNYTLVQPNLTARNITPKALNMNGLIITAPKIYDGTTLATVSGTPALLPAETPGTGTVNEGKPYNVDLVSITGNPIGTYNSKDVLSANAVSFSGLSLTGANASNYTLTIQSPYASIILRKALNMFGLSVPSTKVYDGNTSAKVGGIPNLYNAVSTSAATVTDGFPIIGDDVSIAGTPIGTYNSKDVVSATNVAYSGLSLLGNQASNYTLTIQSNSLATIVPLEINVKADPQTKVYGEVDPYFTFVNDPLIGTDKFMGSLDREVGENFGEYTIKQGTLILTPNYKIIYTPNKLKILQAEIVIQPNVVYRTYGDDPLPTIYSSSDFTTTGLKNNETINSVTISLPSGIGSGNSKKDNAIRYIGVVIASNAVAGNIDLNNYKLKFLPGDIVVNKYRITITAEPKEKRKTQIDPPFTYLISRPLVEGDSLIGQLTREPGEEVGFYKILQGSLNINDNYNIRYVSADLEILTIERVIVVPNAFTPNNDGLNDVLKIIRNSTITSINYFKIFDRSGKQIFETKNINEGWDGKLNGVVAESDAYYWMAEYNTWDNKIFQVKGSFVLIK
jgi:gliding motility-associated-like protein